MRNFTKIYPVVVVFL